MKSLHLIQVGLMLFVFVISCYSTKGEDGMPEWKMKIETLIKTDIGWSPTDYKLKELTMINLPPCKFVEAVHNTAPLPEAPCFAVLPDGTILKQRDERAAARILAAVVQLQQAPVNSLAEVLVRFDKRAAPGNVLYDKNLAQMAIKRLEAAGHVFAPPMTTSGAGKLNLQFYLMNYETGKLYLITASYLDGGVLNITKSKPF